MKKEIKHSKKIITIASISFMVIAGYMLINHQEKNDAQVSSSNFLENFEENSKLTLNYRNNKQDIAITMNKQLNDQGSIKLDENFAEHNVGRYEVSYQLQDKMNNKTNFKIQVGQNKVKSYLKGFPLKSLIFVSLDKKIIEQKVPVDWSGAISFNHPLKLSSEPKRLCFVVTNKKVSTLCHTIPAMKGQLS